MIDIEFDAKSVFTYDFEDLSVGIWDHSDGRYSGPVSCIGKIRFFDKQQMEQFADMLEFMSEKLRSIESGYEVKEIA
jgi:hypothetical protein